MQILSVPMPNNIPPDPLGPVRQLARPVLPDNSPEMAALLAIWQPYDCKRKTVLTAAGETERHIYVVLEGIQRAFYLSETGREATIVFTYPCSFSGVADSFLTQTPSTVFFETLTTSKFLRASYAQLEELQQRFPLIRQWVLTLTAHALKGALQRQAELLCYSAEEKFRILLNRSPHLLQLIPHKYIASYLGLDPATFSKLLGSIRL